MERVAHIERITTETNIVLDMDVDGTGQAHIRTGVGFFDHMLTLFTRHSLLDMTLEAKGDLHVDAHHTVEDTGICIGQALTKALGDKRGIHRYGFFLLPMEEALAQIALDFSGRPHLEWQVVIPSETVGGFDAGLIREFLRAVCTTAGLNLHIRLLAGQDTHHCLEAIMKGVGRAIRMAVEYDARDDAIPSTKGTL